MRTLFLDVASHSGLLALISDDQVLIKKEIDHRISDADLVPLFEAAMQEASWKPEDLTHLACVVGPGGFTSLRVGIAFVNTLAWDLKIPVAGVHLSDLYKACPTGKTVDFLWLHSTKKQEIFVRGFGNHAQEFPKARVERVEELLLKIPEGTAWAGELIPEHRTLMEGRGLNPLSLRPLPDVLPAFIQHLTFSKELLVPWYGRLW